MNVRRTIETTTYVALSAAIGFISFLILVPTLAAGVPLLLLALAGAPLIAVAFVYCHLLARLERRRAAALLGAEFPTRAFPREGSVPVRAVSWMSSRGSWLELLYALDRAAVRRLAGRDARVRRLGRRDRPAQLSRCGAGRRRATTCSA